MPNKTNRRQFLQTTAATTAIGYWVAGGAQAQQSNSPNERVALACVGVDGKGRSDSDAAGKTGDVVALCDVDEQKLEGAAKKFTKAKKFTDFRKMLEEMEGGIDAVTVSTPDHCHAAASLMAMRMGKACFTQKPMTHSIYEARLMREVAREMGVATQMGNQGTAMDGLRRAAAVIRAGALGKVKEVHVWTNRPIWPQGTPRPEPTECPSHVKWDLWLGPAPVRPYVHDCYHPFKWRGWWDFGTGALGDMACHTLNMPFAGLDLLDPVSVQAETSGHNKDSYPEGSMINFEFPANDWRPGLKFVWYDGSKRPDPELLGDKTLGRSGCVVIGEKAKLYSPDDYGARYEILGDVEEPEVEYRKPLTGPGAHFREWIEAIKGGRPAMSNFPDYAGPLTETVLLGNLAVWVAAEPGLGEKVLWDAKNLKSTNVAGLEKIIKPEYRDGYTLDV